MTDKKVRSWSIKSLYIVEKPVNEVTRQGDSLEGYCSRKWQKLIIKGKESSATPKGIEEHGKTSDEGLGDFWLLIIFNYCWLLIYFYFFSFFFFIKMIGTSLTKCKIKRCLHECRKIWFISRCKPVVALKRPY